MTPGRTNEYLMPPVPSSTPEVRTPHRFTRRGFGKIIGAVVATIATAGPALGAVEPRRRTEIQSVSDAHILELDRVNGNGIIGIMKDPVDGKSYGIVGEIGPNRAVNIRVRAELPYTPAPHILPGMDSSNDGKTRVWLGAAMEDGDGWISWMKNGEATVYHEERPTAIMYDAKITPDQTRIYISRGPQTGNDSSHMLELNLATNQIVAKHQIAPAGSGEPARGLTPLKKISDGVYENYGVVGSRWGIFKFVYRPNGVERIQINADAPFGLYSWHELEQFQDVQGREHLWALDTFAKEPGTDRTVGALVDYINIAPGVTPTYIYPNFNWYSSSDPLSLSDAKPDALGSKGYMLVRTILGSDNLVGVEEFDINDPANLAKRTQIPTTGLPTQPRPQNSFSGFNVVRVGGEEVYLTLGIKNSPVAAENGLYLFDPLQGKWTKGSVKIGPASNPALIERTVMPLTTHNNPGH